MGASLAVINWYLIKVSKREKFHLGFKLWDTIFPDSNICRPRMSVEHPLKFKDIFLERKMSNRRYLEYLVDNINSHSSVPYDVDYFEKIIKKIGQWSGDDAIILVTHNYDHFDYVMTGSIVDGDKIGRWNHFLNKIRLYIKRQLSRWRLYRLINGSKRKKQAHAEGVATKASGLYSHSEGVATTTDN